MALSLQEQLLKSGLADKKKAKKIKQEKHKQVKAQQKHKQVSVNEAAEAAKLAAQEKKEKDQALAQEQRQLREQKEIAAQVADLIKVNAQVRKRGDVVLNFTHDNLVKRMYVDDTTHKLVTQGRLSVVSCVQDVYELVPSPVADKIAQRMPQCVIYQSIEDKQEKANNQSEEDDWYAEYDIPDDLMW